MHKTNKLLKLQVKMQCFTIKLSKL